MTSAGVELSSVLARGDLVWRRVGSELVILDQGGSKILGLNPTGGRVWELLDGARSLGEIAGEVAAAHGIEPDRAEQDVLAFAATLAERKLAVPI